MSEGMPFCVFVLSHGRPDNVKTLKALKRSGYTGKTYIVIDDEDNAGDAYRAKHGVAVLAFSKAAYRGRFDMMDNEPSNRGVVFARNAVYDLAESVGVRRFLVLDDDYVGFYFRHDVKMRFATTSNSARIGDLDAVNALMLSMLDIPSVKVVAMSQTGDFIGGANCTHSKRLRLWRKVMNAFYCDTEKRCFFHGRINEDTNLYVGDEARCGAVMLTIPQITLMQTPTQKAGGGMTGLYLGSGTYRKSFYSVMTSPGSVSVHDMGSIDRRLHHLVRWKNTCPVIVGERYKR